MIINSLLKDISSDIPDNDFIKECLHKNEAEIQLFFDKLLEQSKSEVYSKDENKQVPVENNTSLTDRNIISTSFGSSILTEIPGTDKKVPQIPQYEDITIIEKLISIPNAKVNQQYKFEFTNNKFGIEASDELIFENLELTGLDYNSSTREISGIPQFPGDFKINLKIKKEGWTEGKPTINRVMNFVIIPDPRSLWKEIETDKDIIYYKPDSACDFIKVKPTKKLFKTEKHKDIVAASLRGRSHAHEGKPRDDDYEINYNEPNEWYILSVADGAGSAKFSRKGSEIACITAVEECDKHINNIIREFENQIMEYHNQPTDILRKSLGDNIYKIIGASVFKAYKDIEEEARNSGNPIKDYSTTLIVSIAKEFKFGWFIAAYWVGDGGVGIFNIDKQQLKVLGEPDSGDYAGQTRFLTMPEMTQPREIYNRLRFEVVDDFTALILMTDGVSDPKFETDANLNNVKKWNELWEDLKSNVEFRDDNVETAQQLLKWLNFWSQGNHDDRTIAILF